jgi:hypothetical protein
MVDALLLRALLLRSCHLGSVSGITVWSDESLADLTSSL